MPFNQSNRMSDMCYFGVRRSGTDIRWIEIQVITLHDRIQIGYVWRWLWCRCCCHNGRSIRSDRARSKTSAGRTIVGSHQFGQRRRIVTSKSEQITAGFAYDLRTTNRLSLANDASHQSVRIVRCHSIIGSIAITITTTCVIVDLNWCGWCRFGGNFGHDSYTHPQNRQINGRDQQQQPNANETKIFVSIHW